MMATYACGHAIRDSSTRPHLKSRPILKDMLSDLDSLIDWQHLRINMGVDKYKNDKIEKNFPSDIDRQKQEAFDQWLQQTPDASWKNIIDALFEMDQKTLAQTLTKKYEWKDPRVSVKRPPLICDPGTLIKVELAGDVPSRKSLPSLVKEPSYDYYTLSTISSEQHRSEAELANWVEHLVSKSQPHNLRDFLKSIEDSDTKGDFKVGLEARFGKMYWKLPNDSHKSLKPSSLQDLRKTTKKHVFNPEIEETDVETLFKGRECIHEIPRVNVRFNVQGQDAGCYMAVVSESKDDGTFSLDVVYREQSLYNRARVDVCLPGRKYDFRIGDCSECTLSEHIKSQPAQIARLIVNSMHRPSLKNLSLKLCGHTEGKESTWRIDHIRQRIQKQYHWNEKKKWLLVRYDLDVFDRKTNETVPDIDHTSPLLNKHVAIPKFNYSRIEVELWGRKIFPENISDTRPSRPKCHHMESIGEIRFPRETPIAGSNWTADDLMSDFNEFLKDTFTVARLLNS